MSKKKKGGGEKIKIEKKKANKKRGPLLFVPGIFVCFSFLSLFLSKKRPLYLVPHTTFSTEAESEGEARHEDEGEGEGEEDRWDEEQDDELYDAKVTTAQSNKTNDDDGDDETRDIRIHHHIAMLGIVAVEHLCRHHHPHHLFHEPFTAMTTATTTASPDDSRRHRPSAVARITTAVAAFSDKRDAWTTRHISARANRCLRRLLLRLRQHDTGEAGETAGEAETQDLDRHNAHGKAKVVEEKEQEEEKEEEEEEEEEGEERGGCCSCCIPGALADYVLRERIRPLFDRSPKRDEITAQARRALNPIARAHDEHDSPAAEMARKPWKYSYAYILTVFRWLLLSMDVRFLF